MVLSNLCWLGYVWKGAKIGRNGLVVELLAQNLLILLSLLFDLSALGTELSAFKHAEVQKRHKSQKLFPKRVALMGCYCLGSFSMTDD